MVWTYMRYQGYLAMLARVSQFHTYIVEISQKIFYTQNMFDYHLLEVKPADDQQLCCHHCNKYVWYDGAISLTFVWMDEI